MIAALRRLKRAVAPKSKSERELERYVARIVIALRGRGVDESTAHTWIDSRFDRVEESFCLGLAARSCAAWLRDFFE